jgi:putative FmdB family regulatory protein
MPTYEYRCPEGHTFDVFQKISDEPGATCPECGQPAQRQISAGAGFLFRGEGFYITDYRSKEYKEKAKSEKPGSSTKEKTKSDSGGSAGASGGASSSSASGGSSSSSKGSGSKAGDG